MAGYTADTAAPGLTIAGSSKVKADPVLVKTKEIGYDGTTSAQIFAISSAVAATTSEGLPNKVEIENTGDVPLEVMIGYREWTSDTADTDHAEYLHVMLMPGEMFVPPVRAIITSGGTIKTVTDGTPVTNAVPDSNKYVDSGADVDHATSATMGSDTAHTTLNLEDGHSKYFRVGDLIRLTNEICEVKEVGTGADLANSTLTITRGAYGSTAATQADDVAVRLPFFNAFHDFGYGCQTDADGKFKAFNLFGKGRTASATFGITPGSFSMKFYEAGYQALGMSGVTLGTNTGLAASTEYGFDITVDGSGLLNSDSLKFTTDADNLNWGGKNGLLEKINDVFKAQFYTTSSNILNEKVRIEIIDGDVRFTSGQHLSTSAILLAAPSQGETTPFGVGAIPAIGDVKAPVAAKLPDDVIYDNVTYLTSQNPVHLYDDGKGNLKGNGSGTINYETGALTIYGAPPNANFVFSCIENTAFSGKLNEAATDRANALLDVYANCHNQIKSGKVTVRTF